MRTTLHNEDFVYWTLSKESLESAGCTSLSNCLSIFLKSFFVCLSVHPLLWKCHGFNFIMIAWIYMIFCKIAVHDLRYAIVRNQGHNAHMVCVCVIFLVNLYHKISNEADKE